MPDHYQVLGVAPQATLDEIRRAYRDRARALHPDRAGAGEPSTGSAPAMQEVNEAWRVLRDAGRRADYDRSRAQAQASPAQASGPGQWPFDPDVHPFDPDVDLDPRPYRSPLPESDFAAQVVRTLPWLVGGVVLAAIFVITAIAGSGRDAPSSPSPHDLVGRCIAQEGEDLPVAVPCDEPNLGRVDLVASRPSLCPSGSKPMQFVTAQWLCLRTADR